MLLAAITRLSVYDVPEFGKLRSQAIFGKDDEFVGKFRNDGMLIECSDGGSELDFER
jgi:hypothetical protein